ncbi:MAG: phosphopantothenoylcysteine decarboxylase/phosphopantothenate--cysteine ligase [Spirosomataceae bacterium]
MKLQHRKILLGVSGSIAAYKAAFLTRLLVREGAEVKIILTKAAVEFITPLTLATLSKNPVLTSFVKNEQGEWNNHVELGLWADVMLIAPATAKTMGECANGIADNLLVATYLSARCPVFFAPAMDLDMYQHGSTRANLEKLQSFGNQIIESESGELASGLSGQGRLAEPKRIIARLVRHFANKPVLKNKRILITAGPTQEAIDPVRFISNHSSGKMGTAIAEAFYNAGATVTMIAGPLSVSVPEGIEVIAVRSAQEMFEATQKHFADSHIIIFTAAVADYAAAEIAPQKIKKKGDGMTIDLKKTIDIAAALGKEKGEHQFMMGFALETQNAIENAQSKLQRKGFDLIALNSLQDKGAGFRYDTNKITLLDTDGEIQEFELKSKNAVAQDILKAIIKRIN